MPISKLMPKKFSVSLKLIMLFGLGLLLSACSHHQARIANAPAAKTSPTTDKVIRIAKSMLGSPYRYGGKTPETGFDCSGLVYFVFQQAGLNPPPRTSYGQYKASKPIAKSALKRGDLVFFRIRRNKISHVGIYLGNQRFVHAPSSGKRVSIASLNSPYWHKRFIRGGRFY